MNPLLIRRRGMMAKEAVLPDGQLEWLETDGVAYIYPLNVVAQFISSSKMKVRFSQQAQTHQIVCGNIVSKNVYLCPAGMWWSSGNPNITTLRRFFMNGIAYTYGFDEPLELEHEWGTVTNTKLYIKRNGVLLDTYTYNGTISNVNNNNNYRMHIFGCRNYNGGTNYGNVSGLRIYSIKLYSNDAQSNIVFDGLPWRQNGVVGMMDNVDGTFYTSEDPNGVFTGGPNVI